MVQGLGFLAKKSWHVKNKSNQEKVWLAEQRKEAEDRKMKELADQIKQEKEEEEMNQIVGKKQKLDRGIDWMYQGQSKDSEIAKEDAAKKAEEYLLGKAYVPEGAPKGDLDGGLEDEGVNRVVKTVTETQPKEKPIYRELTVQEKNEAFRMRHEDPMFAVTMQQREKDHSYERKKELYERVTGGESADNRDRKKKKKKKEQKKDRKRRHRSRSRSPDRTRHRRRRSPSDSCSDSVRCGRHGRRHCSRSPARLYRDEEHRYVRCRSDDRPHYSRDVHSRRSDPPREPISRREDDRYGLQGKTVDTTNLGPDDDILRRKRADREAERQRMFQQSSRRRTSAKERARALSEMETDARARASAPSQSARDQTLAEGTQKEGRGSFSYM